MTTQIRPIRPFLTNIVSCFVCTVGAFALSVGLINFTSLDVQTAIYYDYVLVSIAVLAVAMLTALRVMFYLGAMYFCSVMGMRLMFHFIDVGVLVDVSLTGLLVCTAMVYSIPAVLRIASK